MALDSRVERNNAGNPAAIGGSFRGEVAVGLAPGGVRGGALVVGELQIAFEKAPAGSCGVHQSQPQTMGRAALHHPNQRLGPTAGRGERRQQRLAGARLALTHHHAEST